MTAWYAVHTHARMERWARSNLWERDFEVYLPVYRKQRRHARKVDWVSAPLFPRYLFVHADLQAGDRRAIVTAPGVDYMVAFGNRTPKLDDRVIAALKQREDENGDIRLCVADDLKPGEWYDVARNGRVDKLKVYKPEAESEQDTFLVGAKTHECVRNIAADRAET